MAEYAQAARSSMASPQASPEEVLERNYLIGRLVSALERHLDIVQRLPEALRNVEAQEARTRGMVANPNPPPVSIIVADHQRDVLEDTHARLKAAIQRGDFLDQEIAENEKRLKASDVAVRQQAERIAASSSDEQKGRLIWLRDLARLRVRAAEAGMDEARAAKRMDGAEVAELRALAQLQQKQLDEMRRNPRFPQADLDGVLTGLDQKIAGMQAERVRIQAANVQSHQLLDRAQRALGEAKAASLPIDRLEQNVNLRRLQADTDDQAEDAVRRTIELLGWERAGWQFRWYLFNAGSRDKLREAEASLSAMSQKLEGWQRYLREEMDRTSQRSEDEGTALLSKPDAEFAEAVRTAYRQRAEIMRKALKTVDSVARSFRAWDRDFRANSDERAWRTVLQDGLGTLGHVARALWDFELFAAEDSMEVDGRRITAVRSVTIGKSLGVILLVMLGAQLTRLSLRVFRHVAVGQFRMSSDRAGTVARWVNVLIVSMLFILALYVANIPLTVFAFLGGALAIGVGFGAQVILKNMISGFILLIERPLRVGDRVEVGSVVGTVTLINIRSSTVHTSDGIEILVPNSSFIENNLTNWTYSNTHVRRSVSVGIDYAASPETVSAVLMSVAQRHAAVLKSPAPSVLLDDFGSDSINFVLRYWIDYTADTDISKIASDLRFMIAAALAEAGINIPFPQRVVHLVRPPD